MPSAFSGAIASAPSALTLRLAGDVVVCDEILTAIGIVAKHRKRREDGNERRSLDDSHRVRNDSVNRDTLATNMDKPKILTAKELRAIMPRLAGWKLAQNKLSRTFEFQDFVDSLSFVNSRRLF